MSAAGHADGVAFVLRPDWLHDTAWVTAAHNYLHAFPAGGAQILWLEVDAGVLAVHEALDILRPLLAPFGDLPFPEVSLSDDPAETPPRARTIVLPRTPELLRQWTPEEFRARVEVPR